MFGQSVVNVFIQQNVFNFNVSTISFFLAKKDGKIVQNCKSWDQFQPFILYLTILPSLMNYLALMQKATYC